MRILLAIAFILCSLGGRAATYYVATNGDDSADGSIGTPFLTLGKASQTIVGGDTIYMRGGIYYSNKYSLSSTGGKSGTQANPTTLSGYSNEVVLIANVVYPSPFGAPNDSQFAFWIKNSSWWRLQNIIYSNNYGHVLFENTTNMVLTNCTFLRSHPDDFTYQGIRMLTITRSNKIQNCTIMKWGKVNEACNDDGEAAGLTTGPDNMNSGWNLVENNLFMYSSHDHIGTGCPSNIIRNNVFINPVWMPTNGACVNIGQQAEEIELNMYGAYSGRHLKPGDGESTVGVPAQLDHRNVYESNRFYYTGPPPDDNGAVAIECVQRYGIFRYNTISFSLGAAVYPRNMSADNFAISNVFYNNVMHANGLSWIYGGLGMQNYSGGIIEGADPYPVDNFFVNNILWNNLPTNIEEQVWTDQIIRTNWNDNFGAAYPDFISTNGIGWHYDPENMPDYHLQDVSPCIDTATWLAFAVGTSNNATVLTLDNSLYFSDGNGIVPGDAIQFSNQTATARILTNDWKLNKLYLDSPLSWVDGQGVSLQYQGTAPDFGAYEFEPGVAVMSVSPTSREISALTNTTPAQTTYQIINSGDTTQTISYTNIWDAQTWFIPSSTNGTVSSDTDTITITFTNNLSASTNVGYILNRGWTNGVIVGSNLFTVTLKITNGVEEPAPPVTNAPAKVRITGSKVVLRGSKAVLR